MTTEALILIPARYDSSRFPGKPLAPLKNKSLIQRVYENMSESGYPTAVVTDDERIEHHLQAMGAQVVRVDDQVSNGTERIALAYQRYFQSLGPHLVVNVQGDEPLLTSQTVGELINLHQPSAFDVTTIVRPRQGGPQDFSNPYVVKVQLGAGGSCENFSRNPLGPLDQWFQHVGVYCYRPAALAEFCSCGPSLKEQQEHLEQLRGLEHGLKYGALVSNVQLVGVDTPEDLFRVQEMIGGQS